ncbi:glycerate kinase [uncultured Anaerococcus sp.]|uniref:glycerate kinase family protein n=1 Tax=uncultured Anaerococcus sp. TaxID=293428 RepID=UPI00260B4F52|nr:glycerate kinase [uncultured Anaerococcus sp.]
MKTLIAIDTIKNFENSVTMGQIFREELGGEVIPIPFLDGGEGTIESMKFIAGGKYKYVNVHNPLNEAITARYLINKDFATIEMAESSGLSLIYKEDLDVMNASSLGLGEVFVDALDQGARSFYIGLGDSACNDMGMGMLYGLGARFYDEDGNSLSPVAKNLVKVKSIDIENVDERFKMADINIATSSEMTLFGNNSFLEDRAYRKGADDYDVARLFRGCENFIERTSELLGVSDIDFPSLGSGGGAAWALFTYFKAKISRPMDYILQKIDFKNLLADVDYIVLGEDVSQFDAYSSIGMARLAKSYKEDIKIIFLHDKNDKKVSDDEYFDYICEYDIDDYLDRMSLMREIRKLARKVDDKYLN